MRVPAIDPAGTAGVAACAAHPFRRWRALLGGLLLALLPGLASAGESEEWPTAPDRGAKQVTRIPWMRFSGDPNAPVEVLGGIERGREVLVVREKELTARQRRLLRRADRKAAKAAKLRAKAGARGTQVEYAVVVPTVRHVEASPPRTVVIDQRRPKVQVVRMDREHDGCDEREEHARSEAHEDVVVHAPVVIDAERLSRDVERQVEQALRQAERARERAQRDQERAQRHQERAQRDAAQGRRRGEAAAREVERAMRDGQLDADERRRIREAARGG